MAGKPEYESPLTFEIHPDGLWDYVQTNGYLGTQGGALIGPVVGDLGKEPRIIFWTRRTNTFVLTLPVLINGNKRLPTYEVPDFEGLLKMYVRDDLVVKKSRIYRRVLDDEKPIADLGSVFKYRPGNRLIQSEGQLIEEIEQGLRLHRMYATEVYKVNGLTIPGEKVVIEVPKKLPPINFEGEILKGVDERSLETLRKAILIEERPDTTFDQIGGQSEVVERAKKLARRLAHPTKYLEWGSYPPRGVLLYGEPGNGKTLIGKALANEAKAAFVLVKAADIGSKWYGETEKLITGVFEICRQEAGKTGHCILFLDEVDSIIPPRNSSFRGSEVTGRVVGTFLQEIDGLESTTNITVVSTTNLPEMVDSAFLSRMTEWLEVPNPDAVGIADIFKIQFEMASERAKKTLLTGDVNFSQIASQGLGMSGRDIADIVHIILTDKADQEVLGGNAELVSGNDIVNAINSSAKAREAKKKERLSRRSLGFQTNQTKN